MTLMSLSPCVRRRTGFFHAPGEPAGSAQIVGLGSPGGWRADGARARASPALRPSSGSLCSRSAGLGGSGPRGRCEQGGVSGNRSLISATPTVCQAIFSSFDRTRRMRSFGGKSRRLFPSLPFHAPRHRWLALPASSFPVRRVTSRSAAIGASGDARAARRRKPRNREIRAGHRNSWMEPSSIGDPRLRGALQKSSRLCGNSNDRAAVYEFQSILGRFRPSQARRGEKIRPRCAFSGNLRVFTQSARKMHSAETPTIYGENALFDPCARPRARGRPKGRPLCRANPGSRGRFDVMGLMRFAS